VREKHVGLLGQVLRTLCGGGSSPPGTPASPGLDRAGESHALDWRAVQARLSPVGHRWDLAILCHLDGNVGCRSPDLLAAINAEAASGWQLTPQVLLTRLRDLERSDYVRHEDQSGVPLRRLYYLQPPGQALIRDLLAIISPR